MEVKEEFKNLIPALSAEEYAQLEANILEEGIREPIITWNGFIIDGHNRFSIAKRFDVEYRTTSKHFASEESVKEWMILNQFGRRNLSNYQRSVLALELEEVFKQKAKNKQGTRNDLTSFKSLEEVRTHKELEKVAQVSHETVRKVKKIQEKAPQEVKAKLATGEVSINAAYKEIKKEEKKEQKENKIKKIKESAKEFENTDIKIYNKDFRELKIDESSIDLILTDPPYPAEYLHLWKDLFVQAKRVLKPNKFLVAYSGQMYLDKILRHYLHYLFYI